MFSPLLTGHLFSKYDFIFWYTNYSLELRYFSMKLVQYNEYLVSAVDTNDKVLWGRRRITSIASILENDTHSYFKQIKSFRAMIYRWLSARLW